MPNFVIFESFSLFAPTTEGQIFTFDECVIYNFYSVLKYISFDLLVKSLYIWRFFLQSSNLFKKVMGRKIGFGKSMEKWIFVIF